MKIVTRHAVAAAIALSFSFATAQAVWGSPKPSPSSSPSPNASASAEALPTATPEPPSIAIPELEAKIKQDPDDKDSLTELASYYLGEQKPDQALALTQRLLSLGVKTAQVYFLDGAANEALGRIREATDDFEQATNLEPTNAQILLTLTNLYIQTGRAPDAERVAKRAATFNPNDKQVLENYGLVLGQEGKFDEARTQFESAAKLDPKDPLPVVLEARSYVSQKALALAGQEFDRALTIDPQDPDALLGKANILAVGHDVTGSVAAYEQLLAVETTNEAKAAVLVQEYTVYRDEKMNDNALATLKRAEQAYPNVPAVHVAFGDYDASIGKNVSAAQSEWQQGLGPQRDNPDALQRLGALALQQGRRTDALGYFKRLSEVLPNDPGVWNGLAVVEAQDNELADARDAYRHSFELARTPQSLAGIGSVDLQMRNYRECTEVFTAIDHAAPDFMRQYPQLLYMYGKCALANGDRNDARSAYLRFKSYVKPGSQLALEVDKTLSSLNGNASSKPAPKPKSTAKPRE